MFQMTYPSNKPKRFSAIREFPYGCGTQSIQNQTSENGGVIRHELIGSERGCVGVDDRDYNHRPACSVDKLSEVESIDVIMKKAGFNVSANTDAGKGRLDSSFSKFAPSCGSKVKPLSSEEAISLIASQSRKRQVSDSSTSIQRELSLAKAVENQRNSPQRSNANRDEKLIPVPRQNKITEVLSPREKVLKVVRVFNFVFEYLNRDKAAGESNKILYVTRAILKRDGMQMNAGKMIGPVPGIEVGDEFQYKTQLSLIGLHFNIRGGIDYTNDGDDLTLATSIISSEGNGYIDRFNADVMIYFGQGGNLTGKDQKVMEDQKLVTGNLALVHSMWRESPVRVIFGKKIVNGRGKSYVYDGLYLVKDYWEDIGPGGNIMFKFELSRVPGQPSNNLEH